MKKISTNLVIILLLIIIPLITITSCKKERAAELFGGSNSNIAYAVAPNGAEAVYIENQLRWIAKSLPILAHKIYNFKNTVHSSIIGSVDKKRYTSELQSTLSSVGTMASPINFNNAVDITVDTSFNPNSYDSAYFFNFEFDECMHTTVIRFLNNETAGTYSTKRLVVAPFYEGVHDTITGYYYDSTTNRIDSLQLHEDNADNYYVWLVDADNSCIEGSPNAVFMFNPENHCGDGKCQPWYNETPANCSDCNGAQQSGTYTLKLQLIQHLYDKKYTDDDVNPDPVDPMETGYHEVYFSNRYDIYYAYNVLTIPDFVNNTPAITKNAWYIQNVTRRALQREWYEDNSGYDTKKWASLLLKKLKVRKDDVIREKESGGVIKHSSSNTPNIITIDKTLCYNFVPNTDRIYTQMCEFDRYGSTPRGNDKFQYSSAIFPWEQSIWYRQNGDHFTSSGFGNNDCPYFLGHVPEEPSFSPMNPGKWVSGVSAGYGPGSFYLDINSNQNTGGIVKFEDVKLGGSKNKDLQVSEMLIRYVLYPNP